MYFPNILLDYIIYHPSIEPRLYSGVVPVKFPDCVVNGSMLLKSLTRPNRISNMR